MDKFFAACSSLLFLASLSSVMMVSAHRPATTRDSCDDDYGSSATALPLADPLISWSFQHYLDCTHRAVWISTVNPNANQPFYVGVGIPPVERFADTRVDALIIGPGLPPLTAEERALIPDEILKDPVWNSTDTIGAYFHRSPQDQSTCDHLGTVMQGESTIVHGRCDFFEPFGQTHSWRVLDTDNILLVEAGATYYVAAFSQEDTSAKIGIALGTWVEDFITPFEIDTPTCTRDMEDFSEKDGLQEECFPVVSCPTAADDGPIGCENEPSEQAVCEFGQLCDEETNVDSCVIAGIAYQAPTMGACGGELCPAAVHTWEQTNEKMQRLMMDLEYTGNARIDFARGMIPHHMAAIDMCKNLIEDLTCTKVEDIDNLEGLVHFCNHVQLEQDIEVEGLKAWLAQRNLTESAPCDSNANVDVAITRQDANGMSMVMAESCGNLSAPSSQKFVAVNHKMHDLMAVKYSCDHSVDFVRMMLPHHAAAVDMCSIVIETTQDEYLMALCDNVTMAQRAEIAWLYDWLQARDVAPMSPCDDSCMAMNETEWMPSPCEDILSTSSFCHGVSGQARDGHCRCDEETFAANNFTCDQPTWVNGFGLFVPEVFCKRSCGMCPTDSRPLWVPGCHGGDGNNHDGQDGHDGMDHGEGMHEEGMMHDDGMMHGEEKNGADMGNQLTARDVSQAFNLYAPITLLASSALVALTAALV